MMRSTELSEARGAFKDCVRSSVWVILSGALILVLKLQTSHLHFPADAISVQLLLVLLGQYACLIFFVGRLLASNAGFLKHFRKYQNETLKTGRSLQFTKAYLVVPALLEVLHFIPLLYGLVYLTPSIVFMGLQFKAVCTPIFKRIFLAKRIYRHVICGWLVCLVSGVGVTCAVLWGLTLTSDAREMITPFLLVFAAGFIGSLREVYHKWLRKRVDSSEYRLTGLEGMFSLVFLALIQAGLLASGIHQYDIVEVVFGLEWNRWQLGSIGGLLIVSILFHMAKAGWGKQMKTVSTGEEFFILSLLIFVDMRFDLIHVGPPNFIQWVYLALVRYLFGLIFLVGRLTMEEDLELRWWGLSEQLKKYRSKECSQDWIKIEEELSIMNRV